MRILISFVLLLIFVIPSSAATWSDPSYDWKTIETAHFSIHYPKYLKNIATDFAPKAEGIHRRLSPIMQYVPTMKTNVVIVDNYDVGNGWATVYPNNLITLYVTGTSSNLNPYSYSEWLSYVFTHEYTHILHMEIVEGGAIMTRLFFGRVLFPNMINPGYILEGYAVYMESHHGDGGRIYNPHFEALMRMDVIENNMKTISQAGIATIRWPGRNLWYVYGAYFVEYLGERYGEDKLVELSHKYGDFVLYDAIDNCYRRIFGNTLEGLWEEWKEHMREKYHVQKIEIEEHGLSPYERITKSGYFNLQPTFSDSSNVIYFLHQDFESYPAIKRLDLSNKKESTIIEASAYDDNMNIVSDQLVFSKITSYKNYYYYKDLYLYDLKYRKLKRLTYGDRAADPSLSSDGNKIVFARMSQGTRSLWIMDLVSGKKFQIGDRSKNVSYYSPVFSTDSRMIAVAKWVKGRQSISLVNLENNQETEHILNGMCGNPTFSSDGKYLLFDSDRSGVSNIYAYRLSDHKIFQVTNVLGIATMPDVSPDQSKIAFVNYTSLGYDIAVVPYNPTGWREIDIPAIVEKEEKEVSKNLMVSTRDTNYNPLPSLSPKLWMPFSVEDENGSHTSIFSMGFDALQQHYYQGQISYDWTAERPIYQLSYVNNQFLPQISLMAMDFPFAYSWDNNTTTYWERYKNQSVSLAFSDQAVLADYDAQSFIVGFENINLTNITTLSTISIQPNLGDIKGVSLGYRYYSSRTYQKSISPEDGIDISLTTKIFSKQLGGDYDFTNHILSSSQYFKTIFPQHILALSETGFLSTGDQLVQSNFTWRYVSVRGYPSTTFQGSKAGRVSMQYRFPISYPEYGMSYGYTFFDRIYGDLFLEAGGATYGSLSQMPWRKSVGIDLTLKTLNGFSFIPMAFTLTYARGLDVGGENKIYFSIAGSGFNTTIGDQDIRAKR